jgi:hypothetical protein
MHEGARALVGPAVKALESRQVWSALIAAVLAVLQAMHVQVPAPLPAFLYAALGAVFAEAGAQKLLTVHAATRAVTAAAVVPTGTAAAPK